MTILSPQRGMLCVLPVLQGIQPIQQTDWKCKKKKSPYLRSENIYVSNGLGETFHYITWDEEGKSKGRGLLRPNITMCFPRQSCAVTHFQGQREIFSMKFYRLNFSNQKATTFCDCQLILSEPRESGKELTCIQYLLYVIHCGGHLSFVIFTSSFIFIFFDLDIEGFVRKRRGGGGSRERKRTLSW